MNPTTAKGKMPSSDRQVQILLAALESLNMPISYERWSRLVTEDMSPAEVNLYIAYLELRHAIGSELIEDQRLYRLESDGRTFLRAVLEGNQPQLNGINTSLLAKLRTGQRRHQNLMGGAKQLTRKREPSQIN